MMPRKDAFVCVCQLLALATPTRSSPPCVPASRTKLNRAPAAPQHRYTASWGVPASGGACRLLASRPRARTHAGTPAAAGARRRALHPEAVEERGSACIA